MNVPNSIQRLFKEVDNLDQLSDSALAKLHCELIHGERVYWYYKDDAEFCKEEKFDVREQEYYSGIVIGLEDNEPGPLEPWDCMIVMDQYPCEKCGPEITWIAPGTLLASEDLVEVYTVEKRG